MINAEPWIFGDQTVRPPGAWPRIDGRRVNLSIVAIGMRACALVEGVHRQGKALLHRTAANQEVPSYAYTNVLLPESCGYTTCIHVYGASPSANARVSFARDGADGVVVVGEPETDDTPCVLRATESRVRRAIPIGFLEPPELVELWQRLAPQDIVVYRAPPGSDDQPAFKAVAKAALEGIQRG